MSSEDNNMFLGNTGFGVELFPGDTIIGSNRIISFCSAYLSFQTVNGVSFCDFLGYFYFLSHDLPVQIVSFLEKNVFCFKIGFLREGLFIWKSK